MKKYVIGVDVGTTGTKAIVVDLDGKRLGSSYRDYPFIHPQPDWLELSAANLREQVITVVAVAVANSAVDPSEIAYLSFSVQRASFAL
ncbi:MAG: FGGY family carbohydrate kinase, partial [Cumulibacter sp.]